MSLITWKQTFKRDGNTYTNADISVYLAGTTDAARVFDVNDDLQDSSPQLNTDSTGLVQFSIDDDDYPTGQLFDVKCEADKGCEGWSDIKLKSLMIIQDSEGGRNFKDIFVQDSMPTGDTIKNDDLWCDSNDDNHWYIRESGSWVSRRDGTIATAAGTANWSEVVDDDSNKPDDNADVTGSNTANDTSNVNTQSASNVIYHNGTKVAKTDDTAVDADDLDESATKKWAGETGATVGAKAGTNLVDSGDSSLGDADVITSQGTANDTSNVNSLAASKVSGWAHGTDDTKVDQSKTLGTWTTKTANFNAAAFGQYRVDTSSSSFTMTLPGSPSAGDWIQWIDLNESFGTNKFIIAPNSNNFHGATTNVECLNSMENGVIEYTGATQGWVII